MVSKNGVLLVLAVLLASCGGSSQGSDPSPSAFESPSPETDTPSPDAQTPPPEAEEGGATIRYGLRLRAGGSGAAQVRYGTPEGKVEEEVRFPWTSDVITFKRGDVMTIRAEIDGEYASPLLCVLASVASEEGSYVSGEFSGMSNGCKSEYELGPWPPDDSDPINNSLIRVG